METGKKLMEMLSQQMGQQKGFTPPISKGHNHAEAYCLMFYMNMQTNRGFFVWNSRDGVTPFIIYEDKQEYMHQFYNKDIYLPRFVPEEGFRIFRDMTRQEAMDLAERRIASFKGTEHQLEAGSARYREVYEGLVEDFIGDPIMVRYNQQEAKRLTNQPTTDGTDNPERTGMGPQQPKS